MEELIQNVRTALRSLRASRGFLFSVVAVLALAIGANGAVFGLVEAVLMKPLPFRDPERLVAIWERKAGSTTERNVVAPSNYAVWKETSRSFASMEALCPGIQLTIGGVGEPEKITATGVTAGVLPLLGLAPVQGRALRAEENLPGRTNVLLVSHDLWQRRFGGGSWVTGRTLDIQGERYEVAGVLPPGFQLFMPTDAVIPLQLAPKDLAWQGRWLIVLGRLADGVSFTSAQAEMKTIAASLETREPAHDKGWSVNLVPLKEQLVGGLRPALVALFVAVAAILLIACTNVASLVLARTAARRHELGVRRALGASGGRLAGSLATEGLLLAGAGGAGGFLLTRALLDLLNASASRFAPALAVHAAASPRVVLFVVAATGAAALVTSLVAIAGALDGDVVGLLKRGTAGPRHVRMRSALLVAQTALSVILLVGGGLLVRSVRSLTAVDPGFAPERVLTVSLQLPGARYETDEKRVAATDALLARVSSLPGVESAATVSWLPLDGLGSATSFLVKGLPEPPPGQKPVADVRAISGSYFQTMGIPVVSGRALPTSPVAKGATVPLLVNRVLSRQLFPRGDALGARMAVDMNGTFEGEVVGIVGDARLASLDTEPRATIYWDARSVPTSGFTLVARTAGGPRALAASVRAAIRSVDPDLAASSPRPMSDVVGGTLAARRSLALLVLAFAAAAVLLTALGLYGVVSYLVTQRTSEIGIRMAIGAAPRDVVGFVVRTGAVLVGLGVAAGLACAFALAPLASRLLYGISPRDAATFAAVPALLLAVALLACALPARRAARIDPLTALRAE